jgi:kynurenine formamidase
MPVRVCLSALNTDFVIDVFTFKAVETAKPGDMIAMKIDSTNAAESSRLYGRHFDHTVREPSPALVLLQLKLWLRSLGKFCVRVLLRWTDRGWWNAGAM